MSPAFLILILSLLSFETTSSLDHGRSPPNYALDLNVTNFDAVLRDTPATYAVVQFFAHWSPACRNYKPHYERVARLFNRPDAVHPGIILLTRVDCGLKINTELCDKFSVGHYPMIFWGPASKFVSSGWKPRQEKSEIHAINDGRTADRLLNWINKKIGSSYTLDDEKLDNEHLASNMSDPGQIARAVYDVEEATTTAFDFILAHKMIKSETRISLIRFLQLLVAHHPSRRCRKGSAEVLVDFDDSYPSGILSLNKEEIVPNGKSRLENSQICGKKVPRGNWMFCRGSKNETRGFSCGLWILLHSLSVRIEDGESQFAFTAICDFIHNFFICEECRQHFYSMCSRVSSPFNTTRDFSLWLWDAHNKVNERLLEEEASLGTGDPKIPKIIWPPKQLCSACYLPHSWRNNRTSHIYWDRQEVFKFLTSYYGKMLISSNKERSLLGNYWTYGAFEYLVVFTNAVVVPVWAALVIAIASCMCIWSTRLLLAFTAKKSKVCPSTTLFKDHLLATGLHSKKIKSQGEAGTKIVEGQNHTQHNHEFAQPGGIRH